MVLTSGTKLGQYEIVAPVGGSSASAICCPTAKASESGNGKLLLPQFTADADRVSRFEREARLLASLNHPHIRAI
jgi:hypothetical protein